MIDVEKVDVHEHHVFANTGTVHHIELVEDLENYLDEKMIKEKKSIVSFPNYVNIMDQVGDRVISNKIIKIPKPDIKTFINTFEWQPMYLLDTLNISTNTKTETKIDKIHSICKKKKTCNI